MNIEIMLIRHVNQVGVESLTKLASITWSVIGVRRVEVSIEGENVIDSYADCYMFGCEAYLAPLDEFAEKLGCSADAVRGRVLEACTRSEAVARALIAGGVNWDRLTQDHRFDSFIQRLESGDAVISFRFEK